MNDISVKLFITKKDLVLEMINSWEEEFKQLNNININLEVIDFDTNPDEVEKNDIVFSPTTLIQIADDRVIRFVGYTKNILIYLRAHNLKFQTEIDKLAAEEFIEKSKEMKKEALIMKEDITPAE